MTAHLITNPGVFVLLGLIVAATAVAIAYAIYEAVVG